MNLKCLTAIAFSAMTLSSFPTQYFWAGGNGEWEDNTKWRTGSARTTIPDTYPKSEEDSVYSAGGGTITVNGTYEIKCFMVEGKTSFAASEPLTLAGSGKLNLKPATDGTGLQVGPYRTLTLDGVEVNAPDVTYVQSYATLVLTNGAELAVRTFYMPSWTRLGVPATLRVDGGRLHGVNGPGSGSISTCDDGTQIVVTGGELDLSTVTFTKKDSNTCDAMVDVSGGRFHLSTRLAAADGCLRQSGGDLWIPTLTHTEGFRAEVTGGKFRCDSNIRFDDFGLVQMLSDPGSRVELTARTGEDALVYSNAVGETVLINGEIVVTNNTSYCQSGLQFTGDDVTLAGTGRIVAGRLVFGPDVTNLTIKIPELVLSTMLHANFLSSQRASSQFYPEWITFGAYGYNWAVQHAFSKMSFAKGFTVDTADWFDRVTPRTIDFFKITEDRFIDMVVKGTGKFRPFFTTSALAFALNRVDVKDSATFDPYCNYPATGWEAPGLRCLRMRFDPDAKLELETNPPDFTLETDLETLPGALSVSAPRSAADRAYAVLTPHTAGTEIPDGLLERSSVRPGTDASGNWKLAMLNGTLAFVPASGAGTESPTAGSHWTGTQDGRLSAGANWSAGVPASDPNSVLSFDGFRNTVVTNDFAEPVTARSLFFTAKSGPFTFRGEGFSLRNEKNCETSTSQSYDCAIAVEKGTSFPIVFENAIEAPLVEGETNRLSVLNAGTSYVAFMGDVYASHDFRASGDVRVGGNFSCQSLFYTYSKIEYRPTMIMVMDGATLTVRNSRTYPDGRSAYIWVREGGLMTVEAGSFGVSSTSPMPHPHIVDGTMDLKVQLGSYNSAGHKYTGTGRFNFRGTYCSYPTYGPIPLELSGTLKAYNYKASWGTGTRLVVRDSPTLGVVKGSAWTFADGDGRSIELADENAVLTVNTQDPDDATALSAVINAPITGEGSLVKDGEGSLTLGNAANAIGGGVHVKKGAFTWTAPQTFASLTVDAGATVQIPESGLSVAGDLSIDGAKLVFPEGTFDDMVGQWGTLLAVPEGSSITGTPDVGHADARLRTVTEGGLVKLQCRLRSGVILIVR